MDEQKRARRLLEEVARRAKLANKINFDDLSFEPQLSFLKDKSRLKAALCSRRSGKTYGIALMLLERGFSIPGCLMPYVTLTKTLAKKILWQVMEEIDRRLDLGLVFNNHDLTITLPNKSQIFLCGANDRSEVERLRGLKYPLVVIDECQAFRSYLKEVITDIVQPACMDMKGQIVLAGTPSAACIGYFHDVTTGQVDGWSVHRWTMLQNAYMPHAAEELELTKKMNGWGDDHPTLRREWYGQWVQDDMGVVYKVSPKNVLDEMPEASDWRYLLGIDLGFNDPTAFAICAYSIELGKTVVVDSYQVPGLIPSQVAEHVETLRERYDFERIVADTGGLGKGYTEEMRQRFALPIEAAQKTKKVAFIELMNGELASGRLLLMNNNKDLYEQMRILQWDTKRADLVDIDRDGQKTAKYDQTRLREDPSFENHLCDALLYCWRESHDRLHEERDENPKFNYGAWVADQEEKMMSRIATKLSEGSEDPWWA